MSEQAYAPEILIPPRATALAAIAGLAANVLLLLALAGFGLWTRARFGAEGLTSRTADLRNVLVSGLTAQFGLMALTGIAMIVWLWRARAAAEVVEVPRGWGRPWVIAGWLVPVVNLWVPHNVVTAVWRVSAPPHTSPWPVYAWWAAWLGCFVPLQLSDLDISGTAPHIRHEIVLCVIYALLAALAALLAAVVVWRITRFQEEQAVRLAQAVVAPTVPPAPEPAGSDPA
jgi:hypothetical protein